ncbi:M23 family metallopeptidase [Streptomyces sp. 7-21]|jgi:murein DD-endopeptidase MepM/ murein hydrolase activator NlpD|uniref:M23 family metallopeptidase n=1 Tax=Streptomyces sp. 7-21 TaxID=2802283 RepID=UPI00191D9B40|nr:M23 family metallopeptidase [Streptomyces sp. 7-21]MBL1069075.1 M23 family metallopeptidase [Streptomyces sp. 7-21]
MSNSTLKRVPAFRFRSRAGAVTAGLCAAALLGTSGVATAAGAVADNSGTTHVAAAFDSALTAENLAKSAQSQAEAQQEAAKAAEAAEDKAKSWVSPVADYALSASFAESGSRWAADHSGQDFAVPSGTEVRAVHGGTVVKAGGNGAGDGPAYGNAVVIKHSDGTYTQYAHLSSVEVSVGQSVSTGQEIARSGNTGNSSGPHLHFEVRTTPDYGSAIDPVQFLKDKDVSL